MNTDPLPDLVFWLATTSLHASLAALVILCLQKALSQRLPARWRFGLWLPFVLILLLPVRPDSPWSVERLWSFRNTDQRAIVATPSPAFPSAMPGTSAHLVIPGSTTKDAGPGAWSILGIVWLTGFATVAGLGFAAYRRQFRRILGMAAEVPPELREEVRIAAEVVGLKHLPVIICSPAITGPAVTGLWRPVLLLPAGFRKNTPAREAALILTHEMLHLKHRDTSWDVLFWLLNTAHWFNPVIWLAFARLRADRESARDAGVLAEAGPEDRVAYGGALLRLQLPPASALFQAGFVGLVNGGSAMRRRMAGLAHHQRISKRWHAAGVSLALLIQFTIGASAESETPKPTKPAAPAAVENPIIAKAKTLMLDRVMFEDANIEAVAEYVRRKSMEVDSKEPDPGKKGVNLILTAPESPRATVTLNLRNVSVHDVLSQAAKQVGCLVGPDATGAAILIAPPAKFEEPAPTPKPAKPSPIGSPSPVGTLAAKLMVNRCAFKDAYAEEVATYIEWESKKLDPAGKGVKIQVDPEAGKGRLVNFELRGASVLDLTEAVAMMSGFEVRDDGTALRLVAPASKK